jgi:hypothetical protein
MQPGIHARTERWCCRARARSGTPRGTFSTGHASASPPPRACGRQTDDDDRGHVGPVGRAHRTRTARSRLPRSSGTRRAKELLAAVVASVTAPPLEPLPLHARAALLADRHFARCRLRTGPELVRAEDARLALLLGRAVGVGRVGRRGLVGARRHRQQKQEERGHRTPHHGRRGQRHRLRWSSSATDPPSPGAGSARSGSPRR